MPSLTLPQDFRIKYAQEEWNAELAGWKCVVQLNLLKSVITILDALKAEQDGDPVDEASGETEFLFDSISTTGSNAIITSRGTFHGRRPSAPGPNPFAPAARRVGSASNLQHDHAQSTAEPMPGPPGLGDSASQSGSLLTGKHQLLKLRLAPLRRVELDLRKRLGAEEDLPNAALDGSGDLNYGPLGNITNGGESSPLKRRATKEFSVRTVKDALEGSQPPSPIDPKNDHHHSARQDKEGEATEVIARCQEDIKSLWTDETVKLILKKRRIRLEESAGFFLEDIDRIASRDYKPSDNDVVRARLRTQGVQEYRIKLEQSAGLAGSIMSFGNEWCLYDVGGSRTGRNAWIPYFEGIHAIIFLAPLSCFDERLLEDSRVNRLEDSFLLWRTVCTSRLLLRASLILFMNKCDLLKRKLKAQVKVKNYLPSYGDRPNDAATVVKYLKDKFKDIAKGHPPSGRSAYYYATSVVDTKTTAITLTAVKDIILREHLKNADFV
ncbi:hypothetical protein EST38_g8483 [Candolleomyces aberdarensis]|uniref:G-alpha-domain-containing protein n=1 Tax=Candolleomyces aberdarensis TaxID=2316362 RepID=A0A4V1Q352_9AGAR|nr:hypothetical protein EST38_g8483 [Candolleomyces aberdarensis]